MPQAKRRAKAKAKSGGLPDVIYAQASPRSIGGTSLFDAGAAINAVNVGAFFSDAAIIQNAAARLQEAGFQVLQVTPTTINIAGSAATYEQAFGRRSSRRTGRCFSATTWRDATTTVIRAEDQHAARA